MYLLHCLWTLFTISAFTPLSAGTQIDSLHHFETLHHNQFEHRVVRRSAESSEKHVTFDSLGRKFDLRLKRKTGLLSHDFRVMAIDQNSNERQVDIDRENLYHGYDASDPDSYVHAYWEDNNMVANIEIDKETYIIEPSWRQLPNSDNYTMIAYKKSDVKMNQDTGKSFCGFVRPDEDDEAAYEKVDHSTEPVYQETNLPYPEAGKKRNKRQASSVPFTPTKNACPVLLVADYRFYENMGQGSLSKTTSYLIGLIDRVDKIYRTTDFGNGYVNMGFEIKEIRVHEAPTLVGNGEEHYNDERDSWETKHLLEVFSRDSRYKQFCLVHLFTYLGFDSGVLGLAYIASPRQYSVGGVCSPSYYKSGHQLFLNTGWSSSLNRYKRRLLTSEADLVTTHEFGHNWGSEHDPDTTECSPGSFDGGKHIMYTYSVSGFEPNNRIFSPCSKRSISAVLASKSDKCFTAPQAAFCGNSNVEEGEECDAGPATKKGDHPCCNKYCRLKPNAQCSDTNDVCCSSCQFTSSRHMCAEEGPCEEKSFCTGTSKDCPPPEPKVNGTTCFDKGKCQDGFCLPFCESVNKISCVCDNATDACKWCCRDNSTSKCAPYPENSADNLPNGMPCLLGYCNEGVCEKQVQDLVERFWDVIVNLNPSALVAFMRANIVGTVIVLSLIVWIPASCTIHFIDKKRQLKDEMERDWLRSDNDKLVLDNDEPKIIRSGTRHRVPANFIRSPTQHAYGYA